MVAIAPFCALRYADTRSLAACSSPPYDVISEEERARFAANPANVVHVILPRGENRYEGAATTLAAWQADGTMVRDATPSFYLYQVRYEYSGEQIMRGFFARVRLDDSYTQIRRHEATLKKPGQDRLDLLRATKVDTEPIQLLYRDERGWVDEVLWSSSFEELFRFVDPAGMEHRMWRVERSEAVGEVMAQFEDRLLVIADGHHRYETALKRAAETGDDCDASLLACLVRDNDPGLHIHATHRLLRNVPDLAEALARQDWQVEPVDPTTMFSHLNQQTVGLLGLENGELKGYLLRDAPASGLQDLAVWRLHNRLLPQWGVDDVEEHVSYTRDDQEPARAVAEGRAKLAIVMAPATAQDVMNVVDAGELMPQKSTFFLPKLASGLVMAPRDEPAPVDWTTLAGDGGKAEFRMPDLG